MITNAVSPSALSVIDALTAHVALLDGDSTIIAVNEAWKRFFDANGGCLHNYGIGSNYIKLLHGIAKAAPDPLNNDRSSERELARFMADGISAVLNGTTGKFQTEYPCHAPWEKRWFLLTVTPFPPGHAVCAVVSHENITALKIAEERTRNQSARLADTFSSMIGAIALSIEKRDPYTAGHQRQVAALSLEIGRLLSLSDDQLFGLHLGATIHDIGKISIPAEILNRPGKLTDPEFMIIRSHAETGLEILSAVDFPWPITEMVHQHHERNDGSGYPQGLMREEICLEARIIAVADVFDAITSHRPYRPGKTRDEALDELRRGRGSIYDPDVVDAGLCFLGNVDSKWHQTDRFDFRCLNRQQQAPAEPDPERI